MLVLIESIFDVVYKHLNVLNVVFLEKYNFITSSTVCLFFVPSLMQAVSANLMFVPVDSV